MYGEPFLGQQFSLSEKALANADWDEAGSFLERSPTISYSNVSTTISYSNLDIDSFLIHILSTMRFWWRPLLLPQWLRSHSFTFATKMELLAMRGRLVGGKAGWQAPART